MMTVAHYILKILALFSKKEKVLFAALFCLLFIQALMQMFCLGAIPAFVLLLTKPDMILSHPLVTSFFDSIKVPNESRLFVSCCLLFTLFLVKNIFHCLTFYAQEYLKNALVVKLQHNVFSAYMNAPYEFHLHKNSSEVLRNIRTETFLIVTQVINNFFRISLQCFIILLIFIMLLVINPLITSTVLLALGLFSIVFLKTVQKKMHHYGLKSQRHDRGMIKSITQGLGIIKEAKILKCENYFVSNLKEHSKHYAKSERFRNFIGQTTAPALELVAIAGMLIIMGVFLAINSNMSLLLPTLVLFGVSTIKLKNCLGEAINCFGNLRYSLVSVDPIYADLKKLDRLPFSAPKKPNNESPYIICFSERIALKNVCFSYSGSNKDVLKGLTLEIKKGQCVAFVGPTGAGKTTILDIILGLLIPTKGMVEVDGIDIHKNIVGWTHLMAYVPQNIYLLDDTIRHNVALGVNNSDIDKAQLQKVIGLAQLGDFISDLKFGMETQIGEHGLKLSGGQRQRIGIARALYSNPKILVLDEATAALDNITENLIINGLETTRNDITTIMVAHRLSTVRNCNVIYYVEDGVLLDSGSYDNLYEQNSRFREMAQVNQKEQ